MIREVLFSPAGEPELFPRAAIVEWLVGEGAKVTSGMPLCRYEIDKAIEEFCSPASGYVRRLSVPVGGHLSGGDLLAVVADSIDEPVEVCRRPVSPINGDFDWSEIDNRGGPPEPLGVMRKTIADRMAMSKRHIPCFYLTVVVDMSSCYARRLSMREHGRKATINDMSIKAAALALVKHPKVAGVYMPDGVVPRFDLNIGFAAALPDDGLVVPVIKNADRKSLAEIAGETRALTLKAKKGLLTRDDCSGGVFSVSYLGGYDVDNFIAIVNPGEAAIAAVGKTEDTPVVEGGSVVIKPLAKITMSSDHRSIDGALAARFMRDMKFLLEHAAEL